MRLIKSFLNDERGLETVEYAIMGGLVVVAVVAAIVLLRDAIVNKFGLLQTAVSS
jgi:Flp pilus assembly pilin Flp